MYIRESETNEKKRKLPGKGIISHRMMEGIKYLTSWECLKEIVNNSVINTRNEI